MLNPDDEFDRVYRRLSGIKNVEGKVARALREAVDRVINGRHTGRYSIEQLDKTEKTYIGTAVEQALLFELGLPKYQQMDTRIDDVPVDIKFTVHDNWMIPREAVGELCLLVSADEARACFQFGLFRALPDYLNRGNRDGKRGLNRSGKAAVQWIVRGGALPLPLIARLPSADRLVIMGQSSGTSRMVELFRRSVELVVDPTTVETVGQQRDSSKRIRSAGGARDILRQEGLLICSHYHNAYLDERGLGRLQQGEFMAVRSAGPADEALWAQSKA